MKTISVKQPYASLICTGIKDIENRTWQCPQKYIGERILIHASAKSANFWNSPLAGVIDNFLRKISKSGTDWSKCETGAIVGSVKIVDCVVNHPSIWAEKSEPIEFDEFGFPIKYDKKIYNWVLEDPILFEKPILDIKGKLGFWNYPSKQCDINCLYGCTESFTKMPDCVNKTK